MKSDGVFVCSEKAAAALFLVALYDKSVPSDRKECLIEWWNDDVKRKREVKKGRR